MLSVVMLSVVMLSVVMLSVVSPGVKQHFTCWRILYSKSEICAVSQVHLLATLDRLVSTLKNLCDSPLSDGLNKLRVVVTGEFFRASLMAS
jgi:hypothetical protein